MYKLITSANDTDDLSIGFHRDRNRRLRELTNNKNMKGKYHVRVMPKDVFGFAEHQEKATYVLGFNLVSDNSVFNKDNSTNFDEIKNKSIDWYVSRKTPPIPQQVKLSREILSKLSKEIQYVENSVFLREVDTQK